MADGDDSGGLFVDDGLELDLDGAASIWAGADSSKNAKVNLEQSGRRGQLSSGGTASGKGGADAKEKKTCKCEACLKSFAPSGMAMNSPYCIEHKRVIDRITAMAKAQNQSAWWSEVRNHKDRTRFRQVVVRYIEQCPPTMSGKRNPYNMASLRTWYETKVAVSVVARGTMMNWERFEAWAKTPEGGGMSKAEAEERWKNLLDDKDVLRDMKGPAKDSTRLRIPVRDDVDLISEYAQGSRQELHTKDLKKPDEQAIDKQRRQLFSLPGMTPEQDMSGVGAGMLANLAGSTSVSAPNQFLGSVMVADVTQLAMMPAEDDEQGEERGGKKKKKGANGEPVPDGNLDKDDPDDEDDDEGTPVKAKPFDVELGVGKARRKAEDAANSLLTLVQECIVKATAALSKIGAMSAEEQTKYAHEKDALTHRLAVVKHVSENEALELRKVVVAAIAGTVSNPCGAMENDKTLLEGLGVMCLVTEYIEQQFTSANLTSAARVPCRPNKIIKQTCFNQLRGMCFFCFTQTIIINLILVSNQFRSKRN
jgi:hypothetical protein